MLAHLAYVSAYFERHHPLYSSAILINDLKRHDLPVRPIDAHHSEWDHTIEEGCLRLGMRLGMLLVNRSSEQAGRSLARAGAGGQCSSVEEIAAHAQVPVLLAAAGALRSLHTRREAL